jgi:hypothetical protein
MPTLEQAVDDLLSKKKQSPNRLAVLGHYLIEQFQAAGLKLEPGDAAEVGIRGLGRQKDWDLAFVLADKPRLLISLKSILKNLSGVVPNRLDDLMGETANVQQLSPEIVIGYVVIMDEAADSQRQEGDGTWSDHFESNLNKIAIRRAPLWNQGLIEAAWVIRINSKEPSGQRLSRPQDIPKHLERFTKSLLGELYLREPALKPKGDAAKLGL